MSNEKSASSDEAQKAFESSIVLFRQSKYREAMAKATDSIGPDKNQNARLWFMAALCHLMIARESKSTKESARHSEFASRYFDVAAILAKTFQIVIVDESTEYRKAIDSGVALIKENDHEKTIREIKKAKQYANGKRQESKILAFVAFVYKLMSMDAIDDEARIEYNLKAENTLAEALSIREELTDIQSAGAM